MTVPSDEGEARALLGPWLAGLGVASPMERMVDEVYVPIAAWMARRRARLGRPMVLGVQGPQGSGKSTFAEALCLLGEGIHALRVATLSLDDLYRTRAEREALAVAVHPLLGTRGVPGTHDVDLGIAVIDALLGASDADEVLLPRFDKAADDRLPASASPRWRGRCDVVIFEGWCVGVPPEQPAALAAPVNALEAGEDPDGRWRRYVDAELRGPYEELWARLDGLVALGVPSMAEVLAWRTEQEHALAAARGPGAMAVMGDAEVARFVMFFERLTLHALRVMPARADVWVSLGEDHLPREVRIGPA